MLTNFIASFIALMMAAVFILISVYGSFKHILAISALYALAYALLQRLVTKDEQ